MNCAIPLEDVVIAKVGHWTTHEKCQRKSDKTVTVFALDKRPNSVWAYCTFYFEFDSTVTRYDYIMIEILWSTTSSRELSSGKRGRNGVKKKMSQFFNHLCPPA